MHTQTETPYTKTEEAPQQTVERHSFGQMAYPEIFNSNNFKRALPNSTPQKKKMNRVRQLEWMTPKGTSQFQLASCSEGNSSSDSGRRVQGLDSSDSFHRSSSEDSLENPISRDCQPASEWSVPAEQTISSGADSKSKTAAMFPSTGRKHMDVEEYKKWSLEKIKAIESQMDTISNKRDPLYKKLSKQR